MSENLMGKNSSKVFSDFGFVLLSIFGGLFIGTVFGIIGSDIYLIFVFPILMGFFGGKSLTKSAKYTKTRNRYIVIISSALSAIVLYSAYHYIGYLGLQVRIAIQAFGEITILSLEAGKAMLDNSLQRETGNTGIVGYMLFKANQEVWIGRLFSIGWVKLGPIFNWINWLIEIGITSFYMITTGKRITKKRFCDLCNSWYAEKTHIGGVSVSKEAEIMNLIKQKDFISLGRRLEEYTDSPSIELYSQSCTSCEKNNSFLTVTEFKHVDGNLVASDLLETSLNPREKKLFLGEIKYLEN